MEKIDDTGMRSNFEVTTTLVAGVTDGEANICNLDNIQCSPIKYDCGCIIQGRDGCVPGSSPGFPGGKPNPSAPAAVDKAKPDPKKQKVVGMSASATKGCLSLVTPPSSFGGFKNKSNLDIELAFCVAEIKQVPGGQWSDAFACDQGKFGATKVPANGQSGDHTKGSTVNYIACAAPQLPVQYHFEAGRGILGGCK